MTRNPLHKFCPACGQVVSVQPYWATVDGIPMVRGVCCRCGGDVGMLRPTPRIRKLADLTECYAKGAIRWTGY